MSTVGREVIRNQGGVNIQRGKQGVECMKPYE